MNAIPLLLKLGLPVSVVWFAAVTIDATSSTTIGSAIAVGGLVVYLVKWMTRVTDRLESLEKQINQMHQDRNNDAH